MKDETATEGQRRIWKPWTSQEDEIVKINYPELGAVKLFESGLLPGRTLNSIRRRAACLKVTVKKDTFYTDIVDGKKLCSSCKEWLPLDHFSKNSKNKNGGLRYSCRSCCVKMKLEWNYSITFETYTAKYEAQGGKCKICKKWCEKLCVDHCHTTGQVRDLLCNTCNPMVGFGKEDPSILRAGGDYCEYHQTPQPPNSNASFVCREDLIEENKNLIEENKALKAQLALSIQRQNQLNSALLGTLLPCY